MAIIGPVDVTGSGPRNSTVEILASDGSVIARTSADCYGNYSCPSLIMAPGDHKVVARCTRRDGEVIESEEITVEVAASAGDDFADGPLSEEDFEAQLRTAAIKADARCRYVAMLESLADGFDVDNLYGELVLEAAGYSLDDFSAHLQELLDLRAEQERSEQQWQQRLEAMKRRAAGWTR